MVDVDLDRQGLLHPDFGQAVKPVVQIRRLRGNGFFAFPALRLIETNDYKDRYLRFGDSQPMPFADQVFDLSDVRQAYAISRLAHDQKIDTGSYERQLDYPVFLILPFAAKQTHEGVEYKSCDAFGEKGPRVIVPFQLKGYVPSNADRLSTSTIVMTSYMRIEKEPDSEFVTDKVFKLSFQSGVADSVHFRRGYSGPRVGGMFQ